MSTPPPTIDPQKATEQMFAMLKSVSQFDEIEVRNVTKSLISPSSREDCFLAIYHRAVAHVETLKLLTNRQHFQAIAMVTRSLFELAVDIRLLDVIADGIPKMVAFSEVEKLRCARKIVKFKADHPSTKVDDSMYRSYIAAEEKRIDANQKTLWPGVKRVEHWSCEKLHERVKSLGSPFDEKYEFEYPRLSWYVHAGLTGIAGMKTETFTYLCGVALKSSTDSYEEILLGIIDELKIEKADHTIKNKLTVAKLLPFTNSKAEAEVFFRQVVR